MTLDGGTRSGVFGSYDGGILAVLSCQKYKLKGMKFVISRHKEVDKKQPETQPLRPISVFLISVLTYLQYMA